jgi:hypothetical protein
MSDTPTPRTDACAKSIDQSNFADSWKDDFEGFAWVPADFAEMLEEELNAVTEQRDKLAEALQNVINEDGTPVSIERADEALQSVCEKYRNLSCDRWSESEMLHPLMHCKTCGQLRGMGHACDSLHNVTAQTPTTGASVDTHINHQTT